MILQALDEYYDRLADEGRVPAIGFEEKAIPFLIVLDDDGSFSGIDDTRSKDKNRGRGCRFVVPKAVKRTLGVSANLLWDNPGYAIGEPRVDSSKTPENLAERAAEQHSAFIDAIRNLHREVPDDLGLSAVIQFLRSGDLTILRAHPLWAEIAESGASLSFRMKSDLGLVCQRPKVLAAITARAQSVFSKSVDMPCLITGRTEPVARLHTAIKGVWGGKTSGANIVSFNLNAFNSYGRTQGYNSPVSVTAEFAYTTALNTLLASSQRFQVGDTSTVFWASEPDELESDFGAILGGLKAISSVATNDDSRLVGDRLVSGRQGHKLSEDSERRRFCILGLAPNASRLSIRFWYDGTVGETCRRMADYLQATRMDRGSNQRLFVPLWQLLAHISAQGKIDRLPPKLGGDVMRAILLGQRMPRSLLSAAIRRCRAEQSVTHERAVIIKLYFSYPSPHPTQKVCESLDKECTNIGYRLGRLFAVLERAQVMAIPGSNTTICDRYYGCTSTSPRRILPSLLKLKNYHLGKLDNNRLRSWLAGIIAEVDSGIEDVPATLSLHQQGLFAIGYYQQLQTFFRRRALQPVTNPPAHTIKPDL